MLKIDGGCHCGAIAYEAEVDPARVSICHCTDCQQLSGSVYRTSVHAAREHFRLLRGKPKEYVKTAESGAKRAQGFCADCGTPIYSADPGGNSPSFFIRAGTVRQRAQLVPKYQLWCRSRLPWLPPMTEIPGTDKNA
jgi:hypothetical protein